MPQCGLHIPIDDRTVEERRHDERPRAVAPKIPATELLAAEEENSDGNEYVIDRLIAYGAELNRNRTRGMGSAPMATPGSD